MVPTTVARREVTGEAGVLCGGYINTSNINMRQGMVQRFIYICTMSYWIFDRELL